MQDLKKAQALTRTVSPRRGNLLSKSAPECECLVHGKLAVEFVNKDSIAMATDRGISQLPFCHR